MKHTIHAATAVALVTVALGACTDSGSMSDDAMQSGAMPAMPGMEASGSGEHSALGTVTAIDRAAGTIDISHGPVESLGWPSMTMKFRLADPDAASDVAPGQEIEFQFTTDAGGTVTALEVVR